MYAKHVLKTAIAYPQIQVSRNNRLIGAFRPQKSLAEHHYYIYRNWYSARRHLRHRRKNSDKLQQVFTKQHQKLSKQHLFIHFSFKMYTNKRKMF